MVQRWLPTTYEELVEALADGRLDEDHHLDFKREFTRGKGANKELAKDLAAFANDGGSLIMGVDEPRSGHFVPYPVPLQGVPERIEQVARNQCDPPLLVEVRSLPDSSAPSRGALVIRIPASPEAPHMVDGRYHGRAGKTGEVLSDLQVKAIIANRRESVGPILGILESDIARDPIPEGTRRNGHLHLVARPRFANSSLVLSRVEEAGNWSTWLFRELLVRQWEPRGGQWSPDIGNASNVGRRAHGAALYSEYMGQDRSAGALAVDPVLLERHEGGLLDIEIDENGTIHVYCGRGTHQRADGNWILPTVLAGLTLRTVQLARRTSELTGFVGTWDFAVDISGLRGAIPSRQALFGAAPAYSAERYRETTHADTTELVKRPHVVVDRLVGRLLRSLGVDGGVAAVFGEVR